MTHLPHRTASALLALLLGGLFSAGPAAAETADRQEDPEWAAQPRVLQLVPDPTGFRFESRRAADDEGPAPPGLVEDRIEAAYQLQAASLDLRFMALSPGEEADLGSRLVFAALVEFVDEERDGRFGPGDSVVQRIGLDRRAGVTLQTGAALAGGQRATVRIPINGTQAGGLPFQDPPIQVGHLQLEFLMVPTVQAMEAGGPTLSPTTTHITVSLDSFPHQGNDTQVALETRITSPLDLAATNERLAYGAGLFQAHYEWDEGDAASDKAGAALPSAHEGQVFVPLGDGQDTEYELETGVTRFQTESLAPIVEAVLAGDAWLYSIGILLSVGVVGGSAFLRLRRGS